MIRHTLYRWAGTSAWIAACAVGGAALWVVKHL